MQAFFTELSQNIKNNIAITDVIDILLVAFLIYELIGFIRKTRAGQLAKGLCVFILATLLSKWLHFYTLHWILSGVTTVGLIAIVVLFQPEIRRMLENLGRSKFRNLVNDVNKDLAKEITGEIVEAVSSMSKAKEGALIVIERETALDDIIETGTIIDAKITAELIGNIFYEGAPLHDGALVIRGAKLYAAGCVLPLTENKKLSKDLGTRHRAGIGITENSDSYVIIVSEETGIISIAEDGKLTRFLEPKDIEKDLLKMYLDAPKESITKRLAESMRGPKNDEEQKN